MGQSNSTDSVMLQKSDALAVGLGIAFDKNDRSAMGALEKVLYEYLGRYIDGSMSNKLLTGEGAVVNKDLMVAIICAGDSKFRKKRGTKLALMDGAMEGLYSAGGRFALSLAKVDDGSLINPPAVEA